MGRPIIRLAQAFHHIHQAFLKKILDFFVVRSVFTSFFQLFDGDIQGFSRDLPILAIGLFDLGVGFVFSPPHPNLVDGKFFFEQVFMEVEAGEVVSMLMGGHQGIQFSAGLLEDVLDDLLQAWHLTDRILQHTAVDEDVLGD